MLSLVSGTLSIGRILFAVVFFLCLQADLFCRPIQEGDLAPDFKLQSMSGDSFSLSQFRGSLVLLNFWATWCPPCVEEIPSMEQLNRRLKARAFNVLAVSVDRNWSEIESFFKDFSGKATYLVLLDSRRKIATDLYGVEKFPESFLIDQNGVVRKKIIGAIDWMNPKLGRELEEILNSNAPKNQAKPIKTK